MPTIDRAHRHPAQHADTDNCAKAEILLLLAAMPPAHRRVLTAALRAPSAHNAQPWRIRIRPDQSYELHYDHHEYLPADPADRDAYLCMGTFCETLAIAATREDLLADIDLVLTRDGSDLHVGNLRLIPGPTDDPLAEHLGGRATNRSTYRPEPLPATLVEDLETLGCTLVPTRAVARIVRRASVLSWRDRQFISDLDAWTRADASSPDGMTPTQLGLARLRVVGVAPGLPARAPAPAAGPQLRLSRCSARHQPSPCSVPIPTNPPISWPPGVDCCAPGSRSAGRALDITRSRSRSTVPRPGPRCVP